MNAALDFGALLRCLGRAVFRRCFFTLCTIFLGFSSGDALADAALPDLKVTAISVSSISGNSDGSWTINTTYTVTNLGTVVASAGVWGGWLDMGFLSSNGTLDNNSQSNGLPGGGGSSLAPGASYTTSSSFRTSATTTPGTYTFFVKADGHSPGATGAGTSNTDNGYVVEADETNNAASVSVTLARPDLKMSSVSVTGVSTNADGSWTINTTYTVKNVGTVAASAGVWGEWNDMAYLSSNGVLDNNSQSNNYPVGGASSLAPGASYTASSSFRTSATTTPGTYAFFVKADGHSPGYNGAGTSNTDNGVVPETDETNNAASASVTLARADLKISALAINDISARADGTWNIIATYTVMNVGTVAATGGWADMGYLSANGVLDNSSVSNNYFINGADSLAPGASYTKQTSFVTPPGVVPGTYKYFVKTDGHNVAYSGGTNTDAGNLIETDETNNSMSVPVTLTRPDLKISALTVNDVSTTAAGGWNIIATYTVTNVGNAATSGQWYDMGYLSTNGVLDSASVSNNYFVNVADSLAPGASYTKQTSFVTPPGVVPGTYRYFVKTDGHNVAYSGGTNTDAGNLVETDETNNAASVSVTLARPDLKMGPITVTGITYIQDGSWSITATYTVTNVGTVPATLNWSDLGYLGTGPTLNDSAQSNGTLGGHTTLAPGASYTASGALRTQPAQPPGNYTFFVKTDGHSPLQTGGKNTDAGDLFEADETNNVGAVPITLTRPDIAVTSMSIGAIVPNDDGSYRVPVTYTVSNVGTVMAEPSWSDMGYLGTKTTFDDTMPSSSPLGGNGSLAPGASYTTSTIFTTAAATTPGNYTFFVKADGHAPAWNGGANTDAGNMIESNEVNNLASKPIYLPVRTATALTSSVNPVKAGQTTTLTATVTPSTATGTVTFYESFLYGPIVLGKAPVNAGVAVLTTSFNAVGKGSQVLQATYSGDAVYYTSTSAQLGETINTGVGTPTLQLSAATMMSGRPLTLTAVMPSAATGAVTFYDASTSLGSAKIANGLAILTTTALTSAGTHPLTAAFAGDANFAGGTSAIVNEAVTAIVKVNSTTTFKATPGFVVTGGSVDVVVTLTGSVPAGNVAIMDGAATLVTIPVTSGQLSTTVPLTVTGMHTLSAHYLGDNYNNPSVSGNVSIEVNETSSSSPGLMTWIYGYDANGNRWIDIDPNGHETDRNYDKLGRPFQVLSPFFSGTSGARAVLGINYDGQDRVSSVLDPRTLTTSYGLDGLGNPLKLTSPDTGVATSTFDENGNMLTRTDSRGNLTKYTYDLANRLKSATFSSGTPTTYEYDGGATPLPYSKGHLTLITDESGSTAYTYDFRGAVVKKVQTISGKVLTTSYTWGNSGSATGVLTSITYPSGARVNYAYDFYGRVTAVSLNPTNPNGLGTNTGATTNLLSSITYNAVGDITGWTWSDAVTYKRTYDSFGRLSSYTLGNPAGTGASAGLTRTIGYNNALQIVSYTHASAVGARPSFDQQFTYDSMGQLITNVQATTSYGFTYDASGNRTVSNIGGASYISTIEAGSNRLSTAQGASGIRSFTYDNAGNTLTDGIASYTYSARGRMRVATLGAGTVSYLYDGLDQRVSKSGIISLVPTGIAYYAYNEVGQIIGEYGQGLTPIYETLYIGSLPISVLKQTGAASNSTLSTVPYNVYADQTNTPRVLTRNTDEAIVWRWDSAEVFGATSPNSNPSGFGVFTYNQRFPGQIFDSETGNFYNWHRDYTPNLGRYAQSDPLGLAGGDAATYVYVGADPLNASDPDGQQAIAKGLAKAAVVDALGGGPLDPLADVAAAGWMLKTIWDQAHADQLPGAGIGASAIPNVAGIPGQIRKPCDPECQGLLRNLYTSINELNGRVVDLNIDKCNMFRLARWAPNPSLTGSCAGTSWAGHISRAEAVKNEIKSRIAALIRAKCPVPPAAFYWANRPLPQAPRGWFPDGK